MPLDGMVISAIVSELKDKLTNGKIEKIYQPESDEIFILIRCFGEKYKLLLSASSNNPRVHLTSINKENPQSPPMFCMLMRKHLQGGRILNVEQKEFERIITIDIEGYDELGFITVKQLIIEIMGKHSNIILMDKSENKIIDSIKRISGVINRYREILPGKPYISPPSQDKENPMSLTPESFIRIIRSSTLGTAIYKAIYTSLQGISPLTSREICYRANISDDEVVGNLSTKDYDALWYSLKDLMDSAKNNHFTPNIIQSEDDHVVDFYSIQIMSYASVFQSIPFDSMSMVLEEFYIKRDLFDRLKQKSTDLRKLITHTIDKLYNKKQKLQESFIDATKSQKYRIFGELLTANLHLIKKGLTEIEVVDFYDLEGKKITIRLDERLSPSQNAQKYFKKYNKSKNALKEIEYQLIETDEEIKYFENLFHSIESVTNLEEIAEVRLELVEEGYIRKRKSQTSNKKITSKPLSFISSDGFEILVGKNNRQNDLLTLKTASKKDLWFHTKDIPGSHVIILCKSMEVPDTTILEAAELAAYHSKAKLSSNVPVDYTDVKNVKKPSGAKPGMVIYENNKTLYITPRYDITKILEKNKSKFS